MNHAAVLASFAKGQLQFLDSHDFVLERWPTLEIDVIPTVIDDFFYRTVIADFN